MSGYIKKIFVNTIGGSVQPRMDLVEIVPREDKLLVEIRVNPEDIAFLSPGLEVSIKFTAYDFTIYGSLKGKIEKISPDSTTDKDKIYYLVYIKSEKNYLESNEKFFKCDHFKFDEKNHKFKFHVLNPKYNVTLDMDKFIEYYTEFLKK